MILRGEIPPGGRVIEVHLAERLRIGRSTVREVVRHLEGHGLLVANESGGMRVVSLDADDLAATLQVRAALEALGAGMAAERVKDGATAPAAVHALAVLADAAVVATQTATGVTAVIADRNFHRAVVVLASNDPCHDALDRLWDRIIVAAPHSPARPRALVDREHRELLSAIAAGDAEGATAIARRHVLATLA